MAFSTQNDADGVLSDINITPLVDVMLVLLVVFIVTTPLLTNAIHVNLPKTTATSAPAIQKAVDVAVDAEGVIHVDKSVVAAADLEAELKALQAQTPDLALHLQADEKVPYGQVAKVMASIEHAGITKLSVLTLPH
jgi:biopolymer transport protein ExbD